MSSPWDGEFRMRPVPSHQHEYLKARLRELSNQVHLDDPYAEFTPVPSGVLDDLAQRLGLQRHLGETDEELSKRIAYVGGGR